MNLTPSQDRAINSKARQILAISGAGSGKTLVLCHRIARLLDSGASPESLLVLTFTNRAADNMRTRLVDLLIERDWKGKEAYAAVRGMMMGTFHSIALRILHLHADRIGYAPNLTVADQDDADLLLKTVARDHDYYDGDWKRGMSWKTLKGFREAQYTGGAFAFSPNQKRDGVQLAVVTLIAEYWQRLRAMNVLDFGLLLREVQRLFRECPDVLEQYRERFKHVLIDECQDLDRVQYNLWEYFVPPATLFAVGDFRQSIYQFRGASPEVLRGKMTDGTLSPEIIDLRENFRSGRLIVEASNRLIAHNGDTLAQPMLSVPDSGDGAVRVVEAELAIVADELKRWHGGFGGFAWRDMAVLARKKRTLTDLEQPLRDAGIPYQRVGSAFDLCQTEEFREVHAYLRLQLNRRDDLAFLRLHVLNRSSLEYATIRSIAADRGCAHVEADDTIAGLYWVTSGDEPLHTAIASPFWGPRHGPALKFWLDCPEETLSDALRWYAALHMDRGEDYRERDCVTLATIHAAKGLEWPLVLVAHMNEGELPAGLCKTGEEILEERRVAYVGLTRAKQILILHSQPENAERHVKPPSRFLEEIRL
ncbi:MAG: ATP-dependent helicase [Phycisphaerales bacterium]